ncbi:MAG: hypothetical protein HC831_13085 [Chloroflexia bacterium]|nr:hypothetical protein [Chloroflexia bacterium]
MLSNKAKENNGIAIIGIGCRFPGNVSDTESYWELISKGIDAISEIPDDRWSIQNFYDANKEKDGKIITKMGVDF